ncbi:SDR family NAD(P)-dependent oxidoreductase [Phycisphaerales bacterium AB-hyl4]|uniref:SDR family NAD(P)-dependent oxidoreductase n=1 Tax=Natronomicrosphaera hydrolytica TaxID=3242702 RepID=A0ABV4UB71_9BACT
MPVSTEMFDLTGKVALVTGGTSGIGKAVAAAFVQHGAKVLVGSRNQEKVDAAAKELDGIADVSGEDPVAAGVSIDVANGGSVDRAVRKAVDLFGGLHIVVNSAGLMCKKPSFDLTDSDFNDLYNIHVTGSLRVAQSAGHIFREQHEGCIINLASISSFVDLVEVAAYASAKNAILGLTRSLANEWAKYGIRTNAIAPGFVPTDINRKMIEGTDRGRRIIEHTPMGRFGDSSEIAGGAVYLASPAGRFVNGHTIVIDGGYLASGIGDSVAPWEKDD